MSEWISVKDRLPEGKINPITQDFVEVLCATTFGDVRAFGYGTPQKWHEAHFWRGAGIMDEYVTHWMPLPKLPAHDRKPPVSDDMRDHLRAYIAGAEDY